MTDEEPKWPDPNFVGYGPCLAAVNPASVPSGVCGRPSKPVPAIRDDVLTVFPNEIVVWLCSEHGGEDAPEDWMVHPGGS